jgi:uncharacterized Zn finger protein (UPF0148 family)
MSKGIDGIPVGTLRSNMADAKVTAERWCKVFGHKYTGDKNGEIYCSNCFKTIDQINRETYEATEQSGATIEESESGISPI